jgi:hypothetical protein
MKHLGNGKWTASKKRFVLVIMILILCTLPAAAQGIRNITAIAFSYYFEDETNKEPAAFRLESRDVLLIRIKPWLSLKTDISRIDSDDFYALYFGFGPVINFTKTFYLDTTVEIGINSDGDLSYKVEGSLSQESDTASLSIGARGNFFPAEDSANDYYYFLPSISGAICPIPQLRLFTKLFFSIDKDQAMTGSVWGDVAWSFTSLFAANAGFTLSYADDFGYSVIAGMKLSFSENISLKYQFQFLSDTIQYLETPQTKVGIENGLILDIRF